MHEGGKYEQFPRKILGDYNNMCGWDVSTEIPMSFLE